MGETSTSAGLGRAPSPQGALARPLLLGLAAGCLLSLSRALGDGLLYGPAVDARAASCLRAGALAVVGLAALRLRVPERPAASVALVLGALAGFAAHGLLLVRQVELGTRSLALLLSGLALALLLPGRRARQPLARSAHPLECLGLALAGGGLAWSLEALARPLRLLGRGSSHDDTLFALTLLAALAVGALAFGPLLAGSRRFPALAAGLALAAGGGLFATGLLAELATRPGLDAFLRSAPWRLDLAYVGRLGGGALIAGRVLLVPGFALGAALYGAGHPRRLASALFGGALGLLALVALGIDGSPLEQRELALLCAERVAQGTRATAVGALAALAGAALAPRATKEDASLGAPLAFAVLLVGGVLAASWLAPRPPILPLSPWQPFAPELAFCADTPEGLLTVESSRGEGQIVTLDRRALTPSAATERADGNRLALAWRAAAEARPGQLDGEASVLLVGQLTPLRAWTLRGLGAGRVDRTAAWHASMSGLEALLFGGPPAGRDAGGFQGEVLAPGEARRRLAAGEYDLVLVPPTGTSRARRPAPGSVHGTPTVVWLEADSDLGGRDLGPRVLLSSDGLAHFSVGLAFGPGLEQLGVPAGPPARARSPLALLRTWPFDRSRTLLADLARRLAEAAHGTPSEDLTAGLLGQLEAQERDSPWDDLERGTEVDAEALGRLARAMLAAAPGSPEELFLRQLWNGTARILVMKREVDLIEALLPPLAERFAPWVELEAALAHADLELLEPAAAAEHLRIVVAAAPYDLDAHMALGHALEMAGDPAAAASAFRRADEIQPGRREVRRRLAMALARAGDAEGSALAEQLLAEDPEDEGLAPFRGPGPFPPPEVRYTPFASEHFGLDPRRDEAGHDGHDH